MIDEIKSAPILNGFRGSPALDKQALSDLLLTVSEVIESYPEIEEMDLNPVMVHDHGIDIADARMILKRTGAEEPPWINPPSRRSDRDRPPHSGD